MPVVKLPVGYASGGWIELEDRRRVFYACQSMILGAYGDPVGNVNFYDGCLVLQGLGLRGPTDREYNIMMQRDLGIADQMRSLSVRTSFLRNVRKARGRYSAKHIASPEVAKTPDGCIVKGDEKAITLPPDGWFTIRELLESKSGLPEKTYSDKSKPDEECAYFSIDESPEMPVVRGFWSIYMDGGFDASALWGPKVSSYEVGIRAVSDTKPNAIALAKAFARLEKISRRHGVDALSVG